MVQRQEVAPEARREAAILDLMTQNARRRTGKSETLRKALLVIASILFFPIALPVYLVVWILRLRVG